MKTYLYGVRGIICKPYSGVLGTKAKLRSGFATIDLKETLVELESVGFGYVRPSNSDTDLMVKPGDSVLVQQQAVQGSAFAKDIQDFNGVSVIVVPPEFIVGVILKEEDVPESA